jgi:hypothetical protein
MSAKCSSTKYATSEGKCSRAHLSFSGAGLRFRWRDCYDTFSSTFLCLTTSMSTVYFSREKKWPPTWSLRITWARFFSSYYQPSCMLILRSEFPTRTPKSIFPDSSIFRRQFLHLLQLCPRAISLSMEDPTGRQGRHPFRRLGFPISPQFL